MLQFVTHLNKKGLPLKDLTQLTLLPNGMWVRSQLPTDFTIVRSVLDDDEYKTRFYHGDRGRELVIDVGAHIGAFATLWHKKNPSAIIVCVEANPHNIPLLTKNVGHFAHIICAAVTYEEGDLYVLDGVASGFDAADSSMIVDESQAQAYRDQVPGSVNTNFAIIDKKVPKITLEEIFDRYGRGMDCVGVVKMDCEGGEIPILSKSRILRKTKTIFGEWHDTEKFMELLNGSLKERFYYGEMQRSGTQGIFHLENKKPFAEVEEKELVPLSVPIRNTYFDIRAAKPKILQVVTMQGIGDILWILTKLPGLLEKEKAYKAEIVISGVREKSDIALRSYEFAGRFDFVSGVSTMDKSIVDHPELFPDGHWNSAPSQPGWWYYDWMLQANSHLEHGNRLEDWMPDIPIDWNIMNRFVRKKEEVELAESIRSSGPYICVYASSTENNTSIGHNRCERWTPEHWSELLSLLPKVKFVVLGAKYDRDYWVNRIEKKLKSPSRIRNMIGETSIGQAVEIIRSSHGMIAYQSGLGCISAMLGVPTCMWWRKKGDSIDSSKYISYEEAHNGAFVQKWMLESRKYIPAIYPGPEGFTQDHPWTPAKIAGHIKRDWPVFFDKKILKKPSRSLLNPFFLGW